MSVLLGSLFYNNVISAPGGAYDPWMDLNDDGVIDTYDLQLLALIYGTSGTPMNKTATLVELQSRIAALEARITAVECPVRYLLMAAYTNETVLKVDPNGNTIWSVDIGSMTAEAAGNPTDGSIYVASLHNLTKLASNGTVLWNSDISFMYVPGVGSATNLDVDPNDGSVYVVAVGGYPYPWGVYKYHSNGTYLWYRQVDFQSVAVNPTDGSVYLNGYTQGVFKYDSDGNQIWQTVIPGGYQNSYGSHSIAVDPSTGSVVATMRFAGPVVKLDADGTIVWQTFTSTDKNCVAVDPYRNAAYVTGSGYLHKLSLTTGNVIWEKFMAPGAGHVTVDYRDGGVYVSGTSDNNLYRVDPTDGSILWSIDFGRYVGKCSFECKFVSTIP